MNFNTLVPMDAQCVTVTEQFMLKSCQLKCCTSPKLHFATPSTHHFFISLPLAALATCLAAPSLRSPCHRFRAETPAFTIVSAAPNSFEKLPCSATNMQTIRQCAHKTPDRKQSSSGHSQLAGCQCGLREHVRGPVRKPSSPSVWQNPPQPFEPAGFEPEQTVDCTLAACN